MENSISTTELDKALSELDGMYNDLSATLKRQKRKEAELAAANISPGSVNKAFDDFDYDIPRPASGRSNQATSSSGHNSPKANSVTFGGDIYARSMKVKKLPNSPSLSVHSDSSSGCGTMPSLSVHPNEIAFPAPPTFDPPPLTSMKPNYIPASDSDYDEVASDEETPSPTRTAQPPTSYKNYAYSDVQLAEKNSTDNIICDDMPDYDEVCPGEEARRSSLVLLENNNMMAPSRETSWRAMLPPPEYDMRDSYATPVVIEMRQINPVQAEVHHQQQQPQIADHTFTNITLERQHTNENNDVSHVTIGTFPVTDSLHSLAKMKTGDEEEIHDDTTMQSNGRTSQNTGGSTMRSPKKKEKKKYCSCAATIPIMSAVIVIVIAIFIVVAVAYVYLGIINDEYLAENLRPIEAVTNPAP